MRLCVGGGFNFFLSMHGVERDDAAHRVKLLQQFLHRWYLVGLFIDLDMRQHQQWSPRACWLAEAT